MPVPRCSVAEGSAQCVPSRDHRADNSETTHSADTLALARPAPDPAADEAPAARESPKRARGWLASRGAGGGVRRKRCEHPAAARRKVRLSGPFNQQLTCRRNLQPDAGRRPSPAPRGSLGRGGRSRPVKGLGGGAPALGPGRAARRAGTGRSERAKAAQDKSFASTQECRALGSHSRRDGRHSVLRAGRVAGRIPGPSVPGSDPLAPLRARGRDRKHRIARRQASVTVRSAFDSSRRAV